MRERFTRRVLCCANDDVAFCTSPKCWIVCGGDGRPIGASWAPASQSCRLSLLALAQIFVTLSEHRSYPFLLIRRLMCAGNIMNYMDA